MAQQRKGLEAKPDETEFSSQNPHGGLRTDSHRLTLWLSCAHYGSYVMTSTHHTCAQIFFKNLYILRCWKLPTYLYIVLFFLSITMHIPCRNIGNTESIVRLPRFTQSINVLHSFFNNDMDIYMYNIQTFLCYMFVNISQSYICVTFICRLQIFFNRDTMLLGNLPFSCKTLAFLVSGNSPSK